MKLWERFSRRQRERELAEEIQAHFEMAVRDRVDRGEEAEAARAAVMREFGNVTQVREVTHDIWAWASLDRLWQDTHYALRTMRRAPTFTAVAVLSLALGIGANTAIFTLVYQVILNPLPVRQPDQLVELLSRYPGEPPVNGFAAKFYRHYRDNNRVFSDLIGVSPAAFTVRLDGRDPETMNGEYVSGNYFVALGVGAEMGRLIDAHDDGRAGVVVLSYPSWKSKFDLDPAIVGRRIAIGNGPATVIGVAARGFRGLQAGASPDFWMPMPMQPSGAGADLAMWLMGRLRPGTSADQARAEIRVLDRYRVDELTKGSKDPQIRRLGIDVEPARGGFSRLREAFAKPLLILLSIVSLLLLIACANIGSMLLARGAARQKEMALRSALGASRLRLVRQLLTESLLLASMAALLGLAVAYWGAAGLVGVLVSGRPLMGAPQPLAINVQPNLAVLGFTAGIALLTGVLFGLAPALQAGRTSARQPKQFYGKALVVAQVALSMVLLNGAGLFLRHLSNLRNLDLGFERQSVLLMTLDPRGGGYKLEQLTSAYRQLLAQLASVPGVNSSALCAVTPISGAGSSRFASVEGFTEEPSRRRYLSINFVSPNYFATFGTPLLAGRDFAFADQTGARVAIVNGSFARHYFRADSPIGKHLTFDNETKPYEIIGVAGDAKYAQLNEAAPRTVYLNAFQEDRMYSQFALKTIGNPQAVAGEVRRAVTETLRGVRVDKVTTLERQVDA